MEEAPNKINEIKKKWEHIPVRPHTFEEFRELKNHKSDNAFVVELLRVYRMRMKFLAKKRGEVNV